MEKPYWEGKEFSFFSHKKCEYFPCHKGADPEEFNCLFCYCPLYALGKDCGGNFTFPFSAIKNVNIFPAIRVQIRRNLTVFSAIALFMRWEKTVEEILLTQKVDIKIVQTVLYLISVRVQIRRNLTVFSAIALFMRWEKTVEEILLTQKVDIKIVQTVLYLISAKIMDILQENIRSLQSASQEWIKMKEMRSNSPIIQKRLFA